MCVGLPNTQWLITSLRGEELSDTFIVLLSFYICLVATGLSSKVKKTPLIHIPDVCLRTKKDSCGISFLAVISLLTLKTSYFWWKNNLATTQWRSPTQWRSQSAKRHLQDNRTILDDCVMSDQFWRSRRTEVWKGQRGHRDQTCLNAAALLLLSNIRAPVCFWAMCQWSSDLLVASDITFLWHWMCPVWRQPSTRTHK